MINKTTISYSILIFLVITLSVSVLAQDIDCFYSIPTIKKGNCANLIQTCSNCSAVNITAIYYPPLNGTVLYPNAQMTKNINNFNYTFCNTTNLGTYIYSTLGDSDGIPTTGNICFSVTPTGDNLSGVQTALYFVPIIALIFLFIFFIGRFFVSMTPESKIAYFMLAYFIGLLPTVFLLYYTFSNYLATLTFVTNIFFYFFYIVLILSPIVAMVCIGYYLIAMVQTMAQSKLIKRGHSEQEASDRVRRKR